jgi:hypothetical protein
MHCNGLYTITHHGEASQMNRANSTPIKAKTIRVRIIAVKSDILDSPVVDDVDIVEALKAPTIGVYPTISK